jgi:hypothetical protein
MTKIITCYSCSGKGKIEIYTQKYYPGTRSTPAFEGSPGYSVNDKPTGQFKTNFQPLYAILKPLQNNENFSEIWCKTIVKIN